MRYGRGHGVHSPRAFAYVQSLARPREDYYDSVVVRREAPCEACELWYRAVARLEPWAQFYAVEAPEPWRTIGHRADSRSGQLQYTNETEEPIGGMVTESAELAERFLQRRDNWVLLLGVRKSREREERLLALLQRLDRGVVLDFYDMVLLFNQNDDLYLYRSSL
ncbi:MAG: hypothetical protein Q4D93_04200 [Porphyromonas sp.]|nr:hypothetical protein [Porphyromonas sp.]